MDIQALLAKMSLQQKVGQLVQMNANLFQDTQAGITGPMQELGLSEEDLAGIGSVLNFQNAREFLQIQQRHMREDPNGIPLIFMMDVIHGYRTIYPIPLAMGGSFDLELMEQCCHMAAGEAASAGVQVTFGPMVDYVRDARWGRVMESCGEDPLLNGLMGAAQVRGFRGDGLRNPANLATCVKHFAAYGGAEAGRDYNTVELSEHTLREFYLPAYKACLDAGADMLMPSFNVLNGIPAVANPWLMRKILREEWQSDVLTVSDYGAIWELMSHGMAEDPRHAAQLAFENGCHMEMCTVAYQNHLRPLVEEGVFSEAQLDAAVEKVLRLKEKLGLFEDPYRGVTPEGEAASCLTRENRALARKAALESAVLLKNDGLLPLSRELKTLAVIGPFADNRAIRGNWGCMGRDEECVSVLEGLQALLPHTRVAFARGCGDLWNETDRAGFEEAVELAKAADAVVLCLGERQDYSGEGNSRVRLELPDLQRELAERVSQTNPNTAAVLFTGRPLVLTELSGQVKAILNMWFPGTEGGSATAQLLLGLANPCGKLTMSFPKATGQCPIYYNRLRTGRPKPPEREDVHVPYTSNYIDCGNLPLYSFGHGLSYSEFVYEDMTLSAQTLKKPEELQVCITVYNNSPRAGKETVMLYMCDPVASVARPVQQLIAFRKVSFEPYQRKILEFTVTEPMLRFWNRENQLVSEPGLFRLYTGYADHLLHCREFRLEEYCQ